MFDLISEQKHEKNIICFQINLRSELVDERITNEKQVQAGFNCIDRLKFHPTATTPI